MNDVSSYDDQDRPDEEAPRDPEQPTSHEGPVDQPVGQPDTEPTQPLHPSYPPPTGDPRPGPWGPSFGDPSASRPEPTAPYPTQPPQAGYGQQPSPGWGPPQQPQQPYPSPYQTFPAPAPRPPRDDRPQGRLPGWAWPVIAALALVIGLLGGVLGGVAVSTSMSDDNNVASIPVIGSGGGAAKPLDPSNGSIAAVAAKLLPSTVQVQAKGGADGQQGGGATGSGFVIDDKDHVITNNHVVADATGPGELKVVDQHGNKHAAKIIGRSPVYDIAVLQVAKGHGLKPAAIGSSRAMHVGDTVVAIGSPLGLSSTVTSGIISAVDRPVTTGNQNQSSYINAVQTDAAINPGNSGGPLVNMRGQVVGVNSAIATTGGSIGGESGNIGVGFAIPIEQVRITASQILATGEARYPVIGANVNTGQDNNGAQVVSVPSGTPAAAAGLEKGDVVTRVNGQPVTDGIGLIVAIRSHQPGETVTLTVNRSGQKKQVRIKLDSKVG
jgi:putative serine protease PepD